MIKFLSKFANHKEVKVADPKQEKQYSNEVMQIHREFETASEKLLESAMEIINSQPKVNVSKIEQLKNLGFRQAKEVEQGSKVIAKTEMSKEQIDLVKYYSFNYPHNKFITEEQVKTICHKYNLVCGDVERFTGFVPEKNMKEILNFKLNEKDVFLFANATPYASWNKKETIPLFFLNGEIRKNGNYYHIHIKKSLNEFLYAFQSENGEDFYGNDDKNIFGLASKGSMRFKIQGSALKICAPVKDMDISGLELIEGYKLERKIEIPDPVVLQPVKGGYLILTAWGDEASDELVVNQNHN